MRSFDYIFSEIHHHKSLFHNHKYFFHWESLVKTQSPKWPLSSKYCTKVSDFGGCSILDWIFRLFSATFLLLVCLHSSESKFWHCSDIIWALFRHYFLFRQQISIHYDKGQLISKYLFGVFKFFQKMNKNKLTWGIIALKLNFFRSFLEDLRITKSPLEINWPLGNVRVSIFLYFSDEFDDSFTSQLVFITNCICFQMPARYHKYVQCT